MFESVLGLNVDKIVDLSLAVAEDISTKTNRILCLGFFAFSFEATKYKSN